MEKMRSWDLILEGIILASIYNKITVLHQKTSYVSLFAYMYCANTKRKVHKMDKEQWVAVVFIKFSWSLIG